MKCLILAAGYATRLYPLTQNFPKPLLKVGEKTILDHLIDDLRGGGAVDGFVVISNHKFADIFRRWAPEGVEVVDDGTSTNETRLGAVCDIRFAIEGMRLNEDLLVVAGDNVLDFSLCDFVSYAKSRKTSCVMRYFEEDDRRLRRSGVLEVDADDRVLSMEEKPASPRSHWCCPPFYYYTAADAALIPKAVSEGCATDAPGSFVSWLASRRLVHAMQMPGRRYDVGSLESYRDVCEIYRKNSKQI